MFSTHLMWLLFSVQHIPSPSWLRPASWPIRPSRCHSSPSVADLCCVTVSTWNADCGWTLRTNPPPPISRQQGVPVFSIGFIVERRLGWSSEGTRLGLLDSSQLGHVREGGFLLLCSKDDNIYFSPFWWHIEHFIRIGIELTFSNCCKIKPYEQRERCSGKTLKTSA